MISAELIGKLDVFFSMWDKSLLKQVFMDLDKRTSTLKFRIDDSNARKVLRSNDQNSQAMRDNYEKQVVETFEERLSPRIIFQAIFEFENLINTTIEQMELKTLTKKIRDTLKSFESEYNKYNKTGFSAVSMLDFVMTASKTYNKFNETIGTFSEMVDEFRKALVESIDTSDVNKTKRLSILCYSEQEIREFAIKLLAIDNIYKEIAGLLGISLIEHPIQIAKVESGSFWADILGFPKIIDLMNSMIEKSVNYLYRNFTIEGKVTAIPKKLDALEAVIDIRKQLKAIGVNTNELDDNINKSAIVISNQLNNLLLHEAKVRVNNKVFSVGKEFEQKYLDQAKMLLLPMPSGDSSNPNKI